jgi:NAD(P)-dependent dehydrogenase (short-subunit alcohol dehydrogenase family)
MGDVSKAVLITGCSSGIGRATARRLAKRGWTVYASARRLESIAELEAVGCRILALDVTDEDSMVAAVRTIEQTHGAVGVLINNAGYSQSGAIESVPLEAVRRQFETNVFGLARLTQLVLPGMRDQRWGKIVNLGSMGGRLVFPGGGWYHATKHALEAISDALRFEVRGFGIDVILLEPGLITTEFGNAAVASMQSVDGGGGEAAADAGASADPYAKFNATVGSATQGAYSGPLRLLGAGPERVAKVIEKSIRKRRAPTRVTITPSAKLTIPSRRLMPDRAWDALMRAQFPTPR